MRCTSECPQQTKTFDPMLMPSVHAQRAVHAKPVIHTDHDARTARSRRDAAGHRTVRHGSRTARRDRPRAAPALAGAAGARRIPCRPRGARGTQAWQVPAARLRRRPPDRAPGHVGKPAPAAARRPAGQARPCRPGVRRARAAPARPASFRCRALDTATARGASAAFATSVSSRCRGRSMARGCTRSRRGSARPSRTC